MRKQWLMGLALSLVLLAGCSASNVVKTYESGQESDGHLSGAERRHLEV